MTLGLLVASENDNIHTRFMFSANLYKCHESGPHLEMGVITGISHSTEVYVTKPQTFLQTICAKY